MSTSTHDTPTAPGQARIDWGRTAMVPLGVVLGGLAVLRLVSLASGRPGGVLETTATALAAALTASFYALIVLAYLRRGPASATSRVRLAVLAAPVATFLPFGLPFAGTGAAGDAARVAGDLLLLLGFAYSVWAVRSLDRSLSVVPQARTLVQHGPYATVRHPLYLGELVAMFGLALTLGGPGPLVLWAALAALQAYRAVQEERLLRVSLPGYRDYQARTARLVPRLF